MPASSNVGMEVVVSLSVSVQLQPLDLQVASSKCATLAAIAASNKFGAGQEILDPSDPLAPPAKVDQCICPRISPFAPLRWYAYALVRNHNVHRM